MNLQIAGYEIREPTLGDVPELFDLITGQEGIDIKEIFQIMLRNCVYLNGEPVGERVKDMPLRALRPIMQELTSMIGLTEKK